MGIDKIHITKSKEETWKLAEKMLGNLDCNVILLQGELGAGKTTFAQGLLQAIGAEGPFTSPTFVIMKCYKLNKSTTKQLDNREYDNVYHLDCYRVEKNDVLQLGWEEIVADKKNLVLVEWPERIKKIWPEKYLKLDFRTRAENQREITATAKL